MKWSWHGDKSIPTNLEKRKEIYIFHDTNSNIHVIIDQNSFCKPLPHEPHSRDANAAVLAVMALDERPIAIGSKALGQVTGTHF
jgi:hypothetical protein